MNWPNRGVYFFFEDGELREDGARRVVRIGTRALKAGSQTSLWRRLSQHKGRKSGNGNHRGSIFRLIVGTSLMRREGLVCPSWDAEKTPDESESELNLELAVSSVIGAMPFVWLDIGDEAGPQSLRGYIERNAIALLSNHRKMAINPPSANWLGQLCDRPKVRESGLWNNNHVDEAYDFGFLDELEKLVGRVRSPV